MARALERVPAHLQKYITTQNYDQYTSRDQAAWRYIMRQSCDFFKDKAVPNYLAGLKRTGISLTRIPNIENMDKALNAMGWGAVVVRGFIPPSAFMELQALRLLPIATDMRTVEHLGYTPAPDIVHEAAGHAPILADEQYSDYLTKYAKLAHRAIYAKHDVDIYEAIRKLSDLKENPDATAKEIVAAEAELSKATAAISYVSEAAKIARMYWWTVEYGLMGSLTDPKIYGAGLLSSVAESQYCLTDAVKKIPLSIDVINYSYDITEPQPQLFVARDFNHLSEVLGELEQCLSYAIGGTYALDQVIKAGTVTTVKFENGLSISGNLSVCLLDSEKNPEFVRYTGPVQLGCQDKLLPGQGITRHNAGFSSPLGRLKSLSDRPFSQVDDKSLRELNIIEGNPIEMDYVSGFKVKGHLAKIERGVGGALLYMTLHNASVTRGAEVFYEPEWGDFDLAIGEQVVSAFGGPVDQEDFSEEVNFGQASTQPGRSTPYSLRDKKIISYYEQMRDWREQKELPSIPELHKFVEEIQKTKADEWLLFLEIIELLALRTDIESHQLGESIKNHLMKLARTDKEVGNLIARGIELSVKADQVFTSQGNSFY